MPATVQKSQLSVVTPVASIAAGTSATSQAQAAPTAAAGTLPARSHFMPTKQKAGEQPRASNEISPAPVLVQNKRKTAQVAKMRSTIKNAPNSTLANIRVSIARRAACQQQRALVLYLKNGGEFPDVARLNKWIDLDGQEISEESERALLWQATRTSVEYRGLADEPDAAVGHREQTRADLYHQQQRRFDKLHRKKQLIKKDKNLSRQSATYHKARKAKQLLARVKRRLEDAPQAAPTQTASAPDVWDDEEEEKSKEEKEVSRLQQEFQRVVKKTNEEKEQARKIAKTGVRTFNKKAAASLFGVEGEQEGEDQQSSVPEDIEFLSLGREMDEEGEEWFKRALPHGTILLAAAEAHKYGVDTFDSRLMAHSFLAKLPMQQAVRVHKAWNARVPQDKQLKVAPPSKAAGFFGVLVLAFYALLMLASIIAVFPLMLRTLQPIWSVIVGLKRRVSAWMYDKIGQIAFAVFYMTLEKIKWLPDFVQQPIHYAAKEYVRPMIENTFWDESEKPSVKKAVKATTTSSPTAWVKKTNKEGGSWWTASPKQPAKKTTTKSVGKSGSESKLSRTVSNAVQSAKEWYEKIKARLYPAARKLKVRFHEIKEVAEKVVRRVYVRLFWKHKGELIEPGTEIGVTGGYTSTITMSEQAFNYASPPSAVCLSDQQCLDVLSSIMVARAPLMLNSKTAAAAASGSRTSSDNRRPGNKVVEQLKALEAENRGLRDALADKAKEKEEQEKAEEEAKMTPAQKSLKSCVVFRTPIADAVKNADLHGKSYKYEEIPDEMKLLPEYKQIQELSKSTRLVFAKRKKLDIGDVLTLTLYPAVIIAFSVMSYFVEGGKKLGDSLHQLITKFWSFFGLPLVGELFSFLILVPLKLGITSQQVWALHDYLVVSSGLMKEVQYNAVISVKTIYADMRSASVASACKQYLPTIEVLVRDETDEEFLPFYFSVADWLPLDFTQMFPPTKQEPKTINLTFGGALIRRLTGRSQEEVSSQISSLYNRDSIHSFSKVTGELDRTVEYAISRSVQENHLEGRLFSSTLRQ